MLVSLVPETERAVVAGDEEVGGPSFSLASRQTRVGGPGFGARNCEEGRRDQKIFFRLRINLRMRREDRGPVSSVGGRVAAGGGVDEGSAMAPRCQSATR